jgi:hypothetical protein
MKLDPESYYRHLGRLIETMPDFSGNAQFSDDIHQWLGRADALISANGDVVDKIDWRSAVQRLNTAARPSALESLKQVLYRVLGASELLAPASAQGTFIPVGNSFAAFVSISKLLKTATRDVMIVDPYMDEAALTVYGCTVPDGVSLRLLADAKYVKQSLQPASTTWVQQYGNIKPLAVRIAPDGALHDRSIFIDGTIAWGFTQSLNAIAKRSPAEIIRADETASMKIEHYESVWNGAKVMI